MTTAVLNPELMFAIDDELAPPRRPLAYRALVFVRSTVPSWFTAGWRKIRQAFSTLRFKVGDLNARIKAHYYNWERAHPLAHKNVRFLMTWTAMAVGLAVWMAFYMVLFMILFIGALTLLGI